MNCYTSILLIGLALIFSCKSSRTTRSKADRVRVGSVWVNPQVACPIHPGTTEISVEYGVEVEGALNASNLLSFCARINELFTHSKLSADEAEKIYAHISIGGFTLDEPFGQPDPDLKQEPTSLLQMKQRIAIRKTTSGSVEVFFVKTGCGLTYFYGRVIQPKGSGKISFEPIEVWRALFPC